MSSLTTLLVLAFALIVHQGIRLFILSYRRPVLSPRRWRALGVALFLYGTGGILTIYVRPLDLPGQLILAACTAGGTLMVVVAVIARPGGA